MITVIKYEGFLMKFLRHYCKYSVFNKNWRHYIFKLNCITSTVILQFDPFWTRNTVILSALYHKGVRSMVPGLLKHYWAPVQAGTFAIHKQIRIDGSTGTVQVININWCDPVNFRIYESRSRYVGRFQLLIFNPDKIICFLAVMIKYCVTVIFTNLTIDGRIDRKRF